MGSRLRFVAIAFPLSSHPSHPLPAHAPPLNSLCFLCLGRGHQHCIDEMGRTGSYSFASTGTTNRTPWSRRGSSRGPQLDDAEGEFASFETLKRSVAQSGTRSEEGGGFTQQELEHSIHGAGIDDLSPAVRAVWEVWATELARPRSKPRWLPGLGGFRSLPFPPWVLLANLAWATLLVTVVEVDEIPTDTFFETHAHTLADAREFIGTSSRHVTRRSVTHADRFAKSLTTHARPNPPLTHTGAWRVASLNRNAGILLGITTFFLSITLGFRVNQAYSRWWEARMLWGRMVNRSRQLSFQTLTHVGGSYAAASSDDAAATLAIKACLWTCVGLDLLRVHLRGNRKELGLIAVVRVWDREGKYVSDREHADVVGASHRVAICHWKLAELLGEAKREGLCSSLVHFKLNE